MPRWLVLRLSICLRKSSVQRSLHRNFMQSSGVVGRGVSRENLGMSICWLHRSGVERTVLQHPGQLGTPGFLAYGTPLRATLLRRLCLSRLRLLSLRPRLLLCCSRRCCVMTVCSLLWLMCPSTLLLVLPGRRLCGTPWVRAQLGGGRDMSSSTGRMWDRRRMWACRSALALAVP